MTNCREVYGIITRKESCKKLLVRIYIWLGAFGKCVRSEYDPILLQVNDMSISSCAIQKRYLTWHTAATVAAMDKAVRFQIVGILRWQPLWAMQRHYLIEIFPITITIISS